MHSIVRLDRSLPAVILASVLWLTSLAGAAADEVPLDYPTANGHFFRQTAEEAEQVGFGIADEDGVPFWTEFHRLGGVATLGYPISRRFYLDGFICQATQRAILQWHPDEGRVRLVNVMDYLSQLGADQSLAHDHLVPLPVPGKIEQRHRLTWLEWDSRIASFYRASSDPQMVFGLPLSPPEDMGSAVTMRFQRGVIYAWRQPQPWAPTGVSAANVGDFVVQARGIPDTALEPEPIPPPAPALPIGGLVADESRRDHGVATWYGAYFQGRPMFNGRPYNMWDPTTAASNSYPMGTRLRVTRVATGESIVVRVTDRGGFRYPILVDLSYAAFSELADPDDGVIRIIVEPVD